MKTVFLIWGFFVISHCMNLVESIPAAIRQEMASATAMTPAGAPGLAPICENALTLLKCVCVTGLNVFNIAAIPSNIPGANLLNSTCASSLLGIDPSLQECQTLFSGSSFSNFASSVFQFSEDCFPSIAGVAGGTITTFVNSFVPIAVPVWYAGVRPQSSSKTC